MAMLSRHTLDLLYVGSLQQFAGIGAIRSASKTLHGPNPGDWQGFPKGSIADNRPIKVTLEAGKKYAWCTCGLSHTQPMCDGSHKKLDGSSFTKSHMKFRPIRFEVEETKDYWLCQCKQSDNRPYCDGTHRNEDIADKKKFATTEDVIENL
ncbi:CDGSH iron-sulfur domain-containing protein 3, mitochondrial isoform X2 [Lingula anatina]|uniref:CDGSH iron-sulfur domain-containing protein 3, mitochondrial isoform X2 n=1 Tax=Lingula anatina TaxID=7574 RepID=A0A1S3H0D3_LINAN|nr:CDGSH iron-sulfur domain-containing protein 3, mitochondrial isoform X2 [Lingula anatina]|eukprot:XP_013379580.1 CDGSH iron-sulfur domain-containing protein 3, mitochondrial isoform X2 [Lingula anatina]